MNYLRKLISKTLKIKKTKFGKKLISSMKLLSLKPKSKTSKKPYTSLKIKSKILSLSWPINSINKKLGQ